MNSRLHGHVRGGCHAPTDPALLVRPLDFIAEDHLREREVCAALDRIATADAPDEDDIAMALAFLGAELPLHMQDEEENLFPLLLRRCGPDDDIGLAVHRLTGDHAGVKSDTPRILDALERIRSTGEAPTQGEKEAIASYANHARRHLILENAIILPFARVRLAKADLEALRRAMQARRQACLPERGGNAQ